MLRCCISIVVAVLLPATAFAEEWQRVVCIDDARLTVTLLVKTDATPADEEFIGWELNNKTAGPLDISIAGYRLDDLQIFDAQHRMLFTKNWMASGNSYDLLWRDGKPIPNDARNETIAAGITRRLRFVTASSLASLGVPADGYWTVEGRAQVEVHLKGIALGTPQKGIPFRFTWSPPDDEGAQAMRARFLKTLREPTESFYDNALLSAFFACRDIASTASVEDLLAGLKQHDQIVRPSIVKEIDSHYAADDRVIALFIETLHQRDNTLLGDLIQASHVHDIRLIEPAMECVRKDEGPFNASHRAMQLLKSHRDLMKDPKAMVSELGAIALSRTAYLQRASFPDTEPYYWQHDVDELLLAGDPSTVRYLLPYLDQRQIILDARMIASMNNGVSCRACDYTYNAILDLLERPGERFSYTSPRHGQSVDEEYAYRDELIAKLKSELSSAK